ETGDESSKIARNVPVTRDVTLDEKMVAHLGLYKERVGPLATKEVGRVREDLMRATDDAGNSPLGQLIADAQLDAARARGAAQVAFMNVGGVRDNLTLAPSKEEGEGVVTYEELHRVQPFGNTLVTMTLSGEQILELLESQWQDTGRARMLQPSAGFAYTFDASKPRGARIVSGSVTLAGEPFDLARSYRVTVNSFLAAGGDGFKVFLRGTNTVAGPIDLDAFVEHVARTSPLVPPGAKRISKVEAAQ
ncbi:MAG: 5'-nucleotidase, partial [Myxococcota bacterium]